MSTYQNTATGGLVRVAVNLGVCQHANRNRQTLGYCQNDSGEQCAHCDQEFCSDHLTRWLDGELYCDACRDIQQQADVVDCMIEGTRQAVYLTSTIENTLRTTGEIEAADVFTGIGVYLAAKLAYLDDVEFYRSGNARAAIEEGLDRSAAIQRRHDRLCGEAPTSSAVEKLMGPGPWPTKSEENPPKPAAGAAAALPIREYTVEVRKAGGASALWRLRGNDEDARRLRTTVDDLIDGGYAAACAIHDRPLSVLDPLAPHEVELRVREYCGQGIPEWMLQELQQTFAASATA